MVGGYHCIACVFVCICAQCATVLCTRNATTRCSENVPAAPRKAVRQRWLFLLTYISLRNSLFSLFLRLYSIVFFSDFFCSCWCLRGNFLKTDFQNTCVWIVTDHKQTPSIDKHKRHLSKYHKQVIFNYISMMSRTLSANKTDSRPSLRGCDVIWGLGAGGPSL